MRTRQLGTIVAATIAAAALGVGTAGTAGAQTEQDTPFDQLTGSLDSSSLSNPDGTLNPVGQSVVYPVAAGSVAGFFGLCASAEFAHIGHCPT